jgi:mono/diheme cytochrome c family protein
MERSLRIVSTGVLIIRFGIRSSVFALAGLCALARPLAAHDIITTKLTYTRDISRIFARRCVACHSKKSSIPLTSYQEVRPWAVDIKEQVLARSMPPWGAVKGFGDLSPDNGLTQEEILIIAAWVVGGAPQGDAALLPKDQPAPLPAPREKLTDALLVSTSTVLKKTLRMAGIKPQPEKLVDSARITARLPDGRIEPLLWLYHYDPSWDRVFRFREQVILPPGTTVEASRPLRYYLETLKAPSPEL